MRSKRQVGGLTLQHAGDQRYTGFIDGLPILFTCSVVNRWVATTDDQEIATGFTLTMCVNDAKENLNAG